MFVDPTPCDIHVELYPRRNPGALPVCVECGVAVLDFDAVYDTLPNGNLTERIEA